MAPLPEAPRGLPRRAYKALENRIGPALPLPLRALWRRAIGRPPLAAHAPYAAPLLHNPLAAPPPAALYDVFCFPIIDWDFRFQRPQQLARALARAGHRVFWINPHSLRDGDRLAHKREQTVLREIEENVYELRLKALRARNLYTDALEPADAIGLVDSLQRVNWDFDVSGAVALVQLPFWAPAALLAAERFGWRVVYDCMDDHAGFSTNAPAMLACEDALLAHCDLAVATSRGLEDKVRERARAVALVPNACDFAHFARAREALPAPDDVAGLPHPIIGYAGAISEWFDFAPLRHAAAAHPDWQFVLIGSTWGAPEHADLAARDNVHLLGEKPYASLPAYLSQFDVACIPFQRVPVTLATNPVKMFEYLAAGKPVVASRLPELERHADLVAIADTPAEFTAALERAVAAGTAGAEARTEFARANDWTARRSTLTAAIEQAFPLASIIVVTWNNLALTRRCIDSILADCTWPHLELIVVDNASRDETPPYLRDLAARDARVKIVLNAENRGFAAANNQGIALAGGEYVALLNNDTEVTTGWLARLIRVLDADHRIGLVGPVTNTVYNEAWADVPKEELRNLAELGERWAREHAGKLYPISMLAMYCVVGRRRVIEATGPLDERFGIGLYEDDDYAYRIRAAGYRLACAEEVFIYHAGQASFGKLPDKDDLQEANRRRFEEKWNTQWRESRGLRGDTLHWRSAVDDAIARGGADAEVVVFLPSERWLGDLAAGVHPLAAELARQGHTVFVCLAPPDTIEGRGLLTLAPNLYLSTVPFEIFENAFDVAVVAEARTQFETVYFPRASVVYAPERALLAGEERRPRMLRSHAELLDGAAVVLLGGGAAQEEIARRRRDAIAILELDLPPGAPPTAAVAALAVDLVAAIRRARAARSAAGAGAPAQPGESGAAEPPMPSSSRSTSR